MPVAMSVEPAKSAPTAACERFTETKRAQNAIATEPLTLAGYLSRIHDLGSRVRFNPNEIIFNQDDPSEYVYQVISGTVRLCRYMPDGRRCIIEFILPGDVMGFIESPDLPACAEAVSDVVLMAFPRSCFDRLAKSNDALRSQLLCHLSSNLLTAQNHMFILGCQRAKERLASFLLNFADRIGLVYGDRLDLPMGRQDVADHLGLTAETVSRMISALRHEGMILVPSGQQIVLRDLVALRALAAES
jgi:CRP/FNR family transcriptional regulator, nitrogen fixation regulation protein